MLAGLLTSNLRNRRLLVSSRRGVAVIAMTMPSAPEHQWMETGSRERDEVSRSARRACRLSGGGGRRGAAVDSRHGGKFGDLAGGAAPAVEEIPGGGTGPVRAR